MDKVLESVVIQFSVISYTAGLRLGEGRAEVCANQQIAVQRTSHLHTNP